MFKKLGFTLALLGCLASAKSQNIGGEIFYQYIGDQPGQQANDYRIFATIFRDTGTFDTAAALPKFEFFQGPNNLELVVTPQHLSSNQPMPPQYLMSPTNPFGWENTAAYNRPGNQNWWSPNKGQGCAGIRPMVEARYVAEVTFPTSLPLYTIIMRAGCCRFTDNIAQGDSLVLSARMHGRFTNSSIRFIAPANLKVCLDTNGLGILNLRNDVLNIEANLSRDSIAFSMPSRGALRDTGDSTFPASVSYLPGYSASSQLPSIGQQIVDPRSGVFTFRPSDTGKYSLVIRATEIRTDTIALSFFIAGYTNREIPIEIVRGCKTIGLPQHWFSSINPQTLQYQTFSQSDSSQGDFAELYWNGQKVGQTRSQVAGQSITTLNYRPAIALINLPYKFALGSANWCGNAQAPGPAHETIAVGLTQNNGRFNATWTAYQGQAVQKYRLYWADSSRQRIELIDSVASNVLTYSNFSLNASAQYLLVEAVIDSSVVPSSWAFDGPLGMNTLPGRGLSASEYAQQSIQQSRFTLYPNPAKEILYLNKARFAKGSYQIINRFGQMVQTGQIRPSTRQLNIARLPAGLYVFNFGRYGAQRFIKR